GARIPVDRVTGDDPVLPQPSRIEPDGARLGVADLRWNQRALLQAETACLALLADLLQRLADGIRSGHVPLSLYRCTSPCAPTLAPPPGDRHWGNCVRETAVAHAQRTRPTTAASADRRRRE